MAQLVQVLRDLSAQDAVDQDVVRGKLAHLFSGLPADVMAEKHEEAMHANGMCRVMVLERLTEAHLQDLGINLGDSIMILGSIYERAAPVMPPPAPAHPLGAAGLPAAPVGRKLPEMRPFPKLGPTGYPELGAWEAYRSALRARMQSLVSVDCLAQLAQIEVGGNIDVNWVDGCADDLLLFPELMNGAGCLPDAMVKKLPRHLKQNSAAVRVLSHINDRVCAVSEASTAVQVEEFQQQRPVQEGKKHLLASVLSVWRDTRDELQGKETQSAAQQRRSLLRMVQKLPEVLRRMEAAEAAHKNANPGTELPVQNMETIVEEFAAKYSSLAVAQGAAYMVKVSEAYAVEPEEGVEDKRKKIPCRFYAVGKCTWGAKCRYSHDGKPAQPQQTRQSNGTLTQSEFNAMSDAWLAAKTAGVANWLKISREKARLMIMSALQEKVLISHRSKDDQNGGVALVVVADTGATVRVIGGQDRHRAVNIRKLAQPVQVAGANGVTLVYEMGDLEGYAGLMTGCLIMPECSKSLCSVSKACEEHSLGYQVAEGNTGSSFTRGGKPVIQLQDRDGMAVLPREAVLPESEGISVLEAEPVTEECVLVAGAGCDCSKCNSEAVKYSSSIGPKWGEADQCQECVVESQEQKHAEVLGLELAAVKQPKWMLQHQLDGHPYNSKCPWCVQGKLKQKQHLRQLAGSGTDMAGGTIKVDLSGKHEPGVTGSTWALIGVHEESDWGYVGLQESKSAESCLVSIQDMEVQLRVESHGKVDKISRFHHDDDKSFRGVVEKYVREKGWLDTHTGGYNPNANAKAEVRIGMLKQQMRVQLLCATGGKLYYEQLWDVCMVYCNRTINTRKWSDRESPIARLTGMAVPRDRHWHPFGVYCLFHIPKENRGGDFRPPSEMGIWVGIDPNVRGGARVVPIEWDSEQQAWILHEVVTATTVRVYETVYPLRMGPKKGKYGSQEFDSFVDKVFHPLIQSELEEESVETEEESEGMVEAEEGAGEGTESAGEGEGTGDPDQYEVEGIVNKREKGGVTQYKVKWKGYNNRHNCWRDEEDLACQELIDKYNQAYLGLSQQQVCKMYILIAMCLAVSGSVGVQAYAVEGLAMTDGEVNEAVARLMSRQQLEGEVSSFVPGYCKELEHMMGRRLRLLSAWEETKVRHSHPIVSLRMLLEHKKDGRKKARLVLQGFKEPLEWDLDSNVSPVAYSSSVRSLVFMGGKPNDILSSIDVSVAFLQSEEYGPNEPPRYVSYKPYKESREYVFQLRGPVYGQRSAPRAWYKTVVAWLVSPEVGFDQGKNEPCVFNHPVTGMRIVLFCDDFLCRGSKEVTDKFYKDLTDKFECKDPTYLQPDNPIVFTGMRIVQSEVEGQQVYSMDLETDVLEFLATKGLDQEKLRDNPMSDKKTLLDTTPINDNLQSWCRSVLGGLHYYARGTRWDISQSVSRISQTLDNPTAGTVAAIEHVAGYMKKTSNFALVGKVNPGTDEYVAMCDASFRGDKEMTSRSQTGVCVCLNGVPIHWRSNRQPKTVLSPAESEVYAMSVGVKDARLMGWVLEELGVNVHWPMSVCTDSAGAKSFKEDTCPTSKLRGAFDYRDDWVEELKQAEEVKIVKVTDADNISDVFTKCRATYQFRQRIQQIRDLSGV
jgi:hypothetical protein